MNVVGNLLDKWAVLLSGNVGVNVYKLDVPASEEGNYVWIYPEGGQEQSNKRSKNYSVVIVVQVVTVFELNVSQTAAETISNLIDELILPNPFSQQLTISGLQVLNIHKENFDHITESVGTKKYYRIVARYRHRVHQTS